MKPVSAPWIWYAIAGLVIVLDLSIKYWVQAELNFGERVYVAPFFDLTLVYNPGAAFSFLAGAGGWQRWLFALIAVSVSLILVVWLWRLPKLGERWLKWGLSLVLGGAVGNLYDRLVHGHVVDFLSFHWAGWYFPAFNLADTAISIGATMLVLDSFRPRAESQVTGTAKVEKAEPGKGRKS